MSEINKNQIAEVKEAMAKAIRLCERLARSLRAKGSLQQWEKTALAEHNDIISACNKSRFLLDCLPAVQVIELESAPTELLPPSAPASVADPEAESEPDSVVCDICLAETKNSIKIGTETLCVACNNWREDKENKRKAQEEAEKLLQDARTIQEKKDKRSTEASKMRKEEINDLQKQIDIYTKIEFLRPLTDKESMVYNKFKSRLSELRANRQKR
jgi:hypothetical protein